MDDISKMSFRRTPWLNNTFPVNGCDFKLLDFFKFMSRTFSGRILSS